MKNILPFLKFEKVLIILVLKELIEIKELKV